MAWLNQLGTVNLKPTKTKSKNLDGTVTKKYAYSAVKPNNINQCPDMHLPKTKYKSMVNNNDNNNNDNDNDNDNKDNNTDNNDDNDIDNKNDINNNNSNGNTIINNNDIKSIQVVHISDTHLKHHRFESSIPYGDILIHSGDFVKSCKWAKNINGKKIEKQLIKNNLTSKNDLKKYIPNEIIEFNDWIGKLSHKYCVVIAGNHEICFNDLSHDFIQKYILTNCIYLQDSFTEIFGLKIYGTPWTTCSNMGFSYRGNKKFLYKKWDLIPNDTDIVISHMPPNGIFDLAWGSKYNYKNRCKLCGDIHKKYRHWGCTRLLNRIYTIKPTLHLFGHVHDDVGFNLDTDHGVLFINSAMDIAAKAHRVKLIFDL